MVAIVGGFAWMLSRGPELRSTGTVAAAVRGPLEITVLARGAVEALESQLIKSEVRGQTKILEIVEDGYLVTEEDVKNKKILVQLDDSEVQEDLTEQRIRFASAESSLEEARAQYQIQMKQNESDITTAELGVKFARIDFQKYVGAELASSILDNFPAELAPKIKIEAVKVEPVPAENATAPAEEAPNPEPAAEDQAPAQGDEAPPADGQPLSNNDIGLAVLEAMTATDLDELQKQTDAAVETARKQLDAVDFASLPDDARLGGDAKQKRQELESKIKLAEQELNTNQTWLDGTQRLYEKKFVPETDLETAQMKFNRSQIDLEAANLNLTLFLQYEFPKQAEKFLSDWMEARRKLARVEREAFSRLAQAKSKVDSADAQFALQKIRLAERLDRIEKCRIVAERAGMVIYAGGNQWQRQGPIEKGANVNQEQEILSIPDMTQMAVNVSIHESSISKVKKGQSAQIRVIGLSTEALSGEVVKVSALPDTQQRWMNPDVKEYSVKVKINGQQEWLQTQLGKTAEVEISIAKLAEALYVPIQAVSESRGERVCFVESGAGLAPERRVVKIGQFNNKYIEITDGLKEGERVLLRAPEIPDKAGKGQAGESAGKTETQGEGSQAGQSGDGDQDGQAGEGGRRGGRGRRGAGQDQPQAAPSQDAPAAAPAANGDAPRGA